MPVIPPPAHLPTKTTSTDRLLTYWYRLLAKTQYTKSELIRKAKLKSYSEQEIQYALNELIRLGFVRDDIVAEGVSAKYQGRKGKRALTLVLNQKGIEPTLQNSILAQFKEELSPALLKQIQRKFSPIADPYVRKDKVLRFLAARGFTDIYSLYKTIEKKL